MDPVPPFTLIVEKFSRIAVCFFCFIQVTLVFIGYSEVELCFGVGFGVVVAVDS